MTWNCAFAIAAIVVLAVAPQRPAPPPTAPPRLVPLIVLQSDAARFTYVLENTGTTPLQYLPLGENEPPFRVKISMRTSSGEYLRSLLPLAQIAIDTTQIKSLAPGAQLPIVIDLNRQFGKLSAGRYVVHIEALGGPAAEGLSPYAIQTDVYVEIQEPKKK